MALINVGVLRGGPSNEYEVSLQTGGVVLRHLDTNKYKPHDIFIDKEGVWHMGGTPRQPENILSQVDVLFNALHGEYGEDGRIQQLLESHGARYTGSDALGSALGMNKALAKQIFKDHGIKTAHYTVISDASNLHQTAVELFRKFPMPAVVKPLASGSSVGVTIAKDFHSLEAGLRHAFQFGDAVIVEEFIPGIEATCGVIEGYRDHDLYALPPIEIRPHGDRFFDYEAKYQGKSEEICPGNFDHDTKAMIEHLAKAAHKALGLRHYSRSDFIVSPRRGVYILEVNTLPGLTEESLFPKSLNAVGSNLSHFFDHLIELALQK